MKDKFWIINKKFLLLVLLVVLFIIALLVINVKAGEAYENCTQIYVATGRKNIPKGDPLYQKRLDRGGKANIACEGAL